MCRFVAYLGHPIVLDEVLFQPKNSLVKQSVHAREAEEPLNGDGFGLGWYNPDINLEPALFTSIQPAWNDRNLHYITAKIFSNCFMAHIRAASQGGVSQFNCHPFHYERFLFMHNGNVGGFAKIKRHIRRELSDPIYDWIKGQTDSEHIAALFLENYFREKAHDVVTDLAAVFIKTLKQLIDIHQRYGLSLIDDAIELNYVLTDGRNLIAIRYTSAPEKGASTLYYSSGSRYSCDEKGICHISDNGQARGAVLVVSEKLDSHRSEWHELPLNHMLLVSDDFSMSVLPIEI